MLEAAIVIGGVVNGPIIGIFTAGPVNLPSITVYFSFTDFIYQHRNFIDIGCLY